MSAWSDIDAVMHELDHAGRIRARKELLRSARAADRMGLSAQEWQDKHAPQWALDELPQAEVSHLMEYVWQGEL